jgi:Skp family chaperone for outer membrane proteins
MNRKSVILTALVAGLLPLAASAQVSPAPPAPAAAPVTPQAIPAKIALIVFEQAVMATNEGQQKVQEIQKKYEPQKAKIDVLAGEIESLKKQADALPATAPQDDRASRLKTIDTKEKQYQRDVEDAQTAYNADLQEAFNKLAQKFVVVEQAYVKDNGFTLLLNAGGEQTPIMWALPETDVTEAVIAAYNKSSGIAAPTPSAPTPARTTPRPAPRPAAPASH